MALTPEQSARRSLQSLYAIVPISFLVIGMQLVMCFFGLIIYFEAPKQRRKGRLSYVISSWLLLILFSLSEVGDAVEMFTLLADTPTSLDALKMKPGYEFSWWRISSSMCLWLVNWLGDGLLLFRCYKIWNDNPWVCLLPGIAYVGSCVTSSVTLAFRIVWMVHPSVGPTRYGKTLQAWIFLSISVNILITILISYRLLLVRKQLSSVLSKQDLQVYLGVVAILVESALPLAMTGVAFAVLSMPPTTGDITVARTIALMFWFCLNTLCPQIIIFRVTIGRSWVGKPTSTSPGSSQKRGAMSTRIDFAHDQSVSLVESTKQEGSGTTTNAAA